MPVQSAKGGDSLAQTAQIQQNRPSLPLNSPETESRSGNHHPDFGGNPVFHGQSGRNILKDKGYKEFPFLLSGAGGHQPEGRGQRQRQQLDGKIIPEKTAHYHRNHL